MKTAQDVLDYWFNTLSFDQWFKRDDAVDAEITAQFLSTHQSAARAELADWRGTIQGRLAEIIVLDQFSRNIYRDNAQAFATDTLALTLAQEAIATGNVGQMTDIQRSFLYMPFMHSESLIIQEQSLKLFSEKGLEANYDFAVSHYDIIKQFGRYPHRNTVLNRESTPEEIAFLNNPEKSFW